MAKVLTDAAVRKFKPGSERRRIRDGGARSLFLIIEPSGHRSWQMRFRRPDGRPAKITLGPLDISGKELKGEPEIGQPLSVAAARALAAAVHRRRALGDDPIADHKARKHRQRAEAGERQAGSFGTCIRDYVAEYARPETRNWQETARLLGLRYPEDGSEPEEISRGLASRWADKPVRNIDGHDIWSVIDEARRVGVPGLGVRNHGLSEARARALFVALSSLFSWVLRQRRVDNNPCGAVPRPAGAKVRDRVLSNDEIRWFWAACKEVDAPRVLGAPRPFAAILKLLLLTGARLNEVAGMRHDELHDDGTWRLPGSRTKNGRAHTVPLALPARELIASVQAKPGAACLMFTTNGRTPVSGWSRMKRRLDAALLAIGRKERCVDVTIAPWRLHDLRRTAVTGMAELGIRPDVIELVVNHVSGSRGGVAGVYNKSELMPERWAALERWAAHVQGLMIPRPGNVIDLPHKARHK